MHETVGGSTPRLRVNHCGCCRSEDVFTQGQEPELLLLNLLNVGERYPLSLRLILKTRFPCHEGFPHRLGLDAPPPYRSGRAALH